MNKSPEELKLELEDVYREIELAFIRKDWEGVSKHVSEGFQGTYGEGQTIDKEGLQHSVAKQFEQGDVTSWRRLVEKLEIDGAKAIAIASGTHVAKEHSGKQVETFLRNQDTWELEDGIWRVTHSQALEGNLS